MSVMLGTVVCTLGLRTTHLSAASMAPSLFNFSWIALPGCGRRNPPAMIFIATPPLPALAASSITSFMNEVIDEAAKAGKGVVAMKIMGGGFRRPQRGKLHRKS